MRHHRYILSVASLIFAAITMLAPPALAQQDVLSNLRVDSTTVTKSGFVHVTGSVDCTIEGVVIEFNASVQQRHARDSEDNRTTCSNGVATTTVVLFSIPPQQQFHPGRATLTLSANTDCRPGECVNEQEALRNVRVILKPEK